MHDAGYIFAPYIPLQMTPLRKETIDEFAKQVGLKSKYGKKMVQPDYYGKITVEGSKYIIENYLHESDGDYFIGKLESGINLDDL